MALLYMTGFDYHDNNQMSDDGWAGINSTHGSYGRLGTKGVWVSASTGYMMRNFGWPDKSTLVLGFAFYKSSVNAPTYSASYPLIAFYDTAGVEQVRLHVNPNQGIDIYNGAGSLLGSSSDGIVKNLRWHYMEIKVTVHDTTGVVEVHLDETQVVNLTSKDTKNGDDYLQRIRFRSMYSAITVYYDDIYVDDANFLGNCHVSTFYPDADGNSSDFTRSAGSNDYECVDETPSNEDTDYISSDTLNHKSIFGITTGALPTVKGIQVNNHCKLSEAGSRKIKAICRSNSIDYQGTESDAISLSYLFEHEIWELDPDDSGAWTQTKLEAAEFGLEITT